MRPGIDAPGSVGCARLRAPRRRAGEPRLRRTLDACTCASAAAHWPLDRGDRRRLRPLWRVHQPGPHVAHLVGAGHRRAAAARRQQRQRRGLGEARSRSLSHATRARALAAPQALPSGARYSAGRSSGSLRTGALCARARTFVASGAPSFCAPRPSTSPNDRFAWRDGGNKGEDRASGNAFDLRYL